MRDGMSHLCHTEPFFGFDGPIERSITTAGEVKSEQRLRVARRVARPAGLEPATPGLEGPLSYGYTGGYIGRQSVARRCPARSQLNRSRARSQ